MRSYFLDPINSEADAEGFFFCLEQDGLLFHPEDDPASIINKTGKVLFNDEEAEALRSRIDEAYQFMDDPCDFILTLQTYNLNR